MAGSGKDFQPKLIVDRDNFHARNGHRWFPRNLSVPLKGVCRHRLKKLSCSDEHSLIYSRGEVPKQNISEGHLFEGRGSEQNISEGHLFEGRGSEQIYQRAIYSRGEGSEQIYQRAIYSRGEVPNKYIRGPFIRGERFRTNISEGHLFEGRGSEQIYQRVGYFNSLNEYQWTIFVECLQNI